MIDQRAAHVKPFPKIGVPFAALPLDILRRSDLSASAKMIFQAIANNARMKRGSVSTWTNADIAAEVGMTASGVRRPLGELEAAGLIQRAYDDSGRVRESIVITYDPSPAQALGVGAPAPTRAEPAERQRQGGWREHAKEVGAETTTLLLAKKESVEEAASAVEEEAKTAEALSALRSMFKRTGVHAVAAAYSPAFGAVRNTPEQLRHQAAHWRELRPNPSPAPPREAAPPPVRSTQSGYFRPNG